MNVLGINCSLHDISVALMIDNTLAMAIEEERLTKNKHQGGIFVDGNMPQKALQRIFKSFPNIQIDRYCYSGDLFFQPVYLSTKCSQQLSFVRQLDPDLSKTVFVDHHLCHALSAYAQSGYHTSAVIVADGEGDSCSVSIWKISPGNVMPLLKLPPSSSLGNMYSYITDKLGFHNFGDEGKVMALADYGKPISSFELISFFSDSYYEVDYNELIRLGKMATNAKTFEEKANVAATIQSSLEKVMIWLCAVAKRLSDCEDVCLSGGVAYNCKANYKIWKTGGAKNLFVPNMPGDSGNSIGAAVYPFVSEGIFRRYNISPYVGPSYSNEQIRLKLDEYHADYFIPEDICAFTAEVLAAGHPVLFFSGHMELGPRALGNRSILAPINVPGIAKFINDNLKHREPWRPFAPAILSDFLDKYFVNPIPSPFMSFAEAIVPEMSAQLGEVSSIDGTARVQTVSNDSDTVLYDVLQKYYKLTGIPLLLNTSFNDKGQPIIEDFTDALKMFYTSCVDYLILENIVVQKKN